MARVVSHAVKQASLNLKDMIDKKPLGLEVEDLKADTTLLTSGTLNINGSRFWNKSDEKPEIIQTAIEQIKGLFNVGKEVSGWTANYYSAEHFASVKGATLNIPPGEKGLGGRFIIVMGTREIANLSVSMGNVEAENPMTMLSGDCLHLKITICPVLNVAFNNVGAEKLAAKKGFREMIVKKNFSSRHVLVIDAHVEVSDVISHVAKNIMNKTGISSPVEE